MNQRQGRLGPLALLCVAALVGGGCLGASVVGGPEDGGSGSDGATDVAADGAFDAPQALDVAADAADAADAGDSGTAPDAAVDGAVAADASDAVPTCTTNAQCSDNEFGQNVCDTTTGRCVRCTATDDRCAVGEYCNPASNTCVRGCRSDEACRGAVDGGVADGGFVSGGRCNPTTRTCVDCVTDDQCATGQRCVGSVCVTGCTDSSRCGMGEACCGGGCVDTQANTANCGMCGTTCTTPNGAPRCEMGTCRIAECTGAFRDCDSTVANGCETNTLSDLNNCGSCGRVCPTPANASASCAAGACGFTCLEGFADCDGEAENGCEVDLRTDRTHCGRCMNTCSPSSGTGACSMGMCVVTACDEGFGDCDGMAANGCEVDVRASTSHCGTCGTMCPVPTNGSATCMMGRCGASCAEGFADCDGMAANGCEVDTRTDNTHCGACGRPCVIPNGTPSCTAGACRVGMCNEGFADCDGMPENGCEVDTRTTSTHCGRCNNECAVAGGSAACTAGSCVVGGCATGRGDCDMNTDNGCEVDTQTSPTNCGACGRTCVVPNATAACRGGACVVGVCNAGFGDCDGDPTNGCETDLRTNTNNCGACGSVCFAANGVAVCGGGACRLDRCNPGFNDCNNFYSDGCEIATVSDVDNCGRCSNACPTPPSGSRVCVAGLCAIGTCAAGRGDCDGDPTTGCEVNTNTSVQHCGGCGRTCAARANASVFCSSGACSFTCNPGFADCDGNPVNGCEVDTRTNTGSCGRCGNVCSAANGTSTCVAGVCGIGACNSGFANCDGLASNGCEVDTRSSAANCGACGRVCTAPTGGSVRCSASACVQSCPAGQTNCGGVCRATGATCSSAGTGGCAQAGTIVCSGTSTVCSAVPRTSGTCSSPVGGACGAGGVCACPAGQTNCGGTCRALTSDTNNCGGCGIVCSAPIGGSVTCSAGACVRTCPAGQTNCGGTCRATGGACSSAGTGGCAQAGTIVCSGTTTTCSAVPRTSGACSTPAGGLCGAGGVCACPSGLSNCSGTCRNLTSDNASCGACGRACTASQACVSGVCVGQGSLRFTLTWTTNGDMDLHVRPPCGTEIYYGSRSACGGTLDRDDTSTRGPENIYWNASYTPGRYYVCPEAYTTTVANTTWTLVVVRNGIEVARRTGVRGRRDGNIACSASFPGVVVLDL